jgi:hypothetical protein
MDDATPLARWEVAVAPDVTVSGGRTSESSDMASGGYRRRSGIGQLVDG